MVCSWCNTVFKSSWCWWSLFSLSNHVKLWLRAFVGFFACVEWLVSVHFCLCSLLHQGSCWFTEKKQLKYICHRLFCCCVKPKAISFEQGKRLLKLLTWIQGVHEIPFQAVCYWLYLPNLNSLLRFQKAFSLIEQKCLWLNTAAKQMKKKLFYLHIHFIVFSKRRGRILIEGFWLSSRYQMLTLWPSGNSGSLWRRVVRRSTLDARSRFDILGNFKVLLLTVRFLFPFSKWLVRVCISHNF